MILSFINILKVPRELLKTLGFSFDLDFQHFTPDLANVNEWKIMFDPFIRNYACFNPGFLQAVEDR